MITNETRRNIAENVVTDANANVLAPQPSARATLSPEAALLFNKSIVARPLMVPEVCSIRIKNTEYRYRWVNAASKNGSMYMQRKAQGFTNATTDDVQVLGGDAVANQGEIRAGDVILMKIRADLYDAAIKWNMQKASVLQRSRGMYLKDASGDVFADANAQKVSVAQEPFAKTDKASNFIPDDPDKLFAGALATKEVARKQTQEIRDKIATEKSSAAKD